MTTFESSSLPIDEESPESLHLFGTNDRLLIEHGSYENDLKLLTSIDLKTGEQDVYNLSEDLHLGDGVPNFQSIVSLDGQRLLILTQPHYYQSDEISAALYLYDMSNRKLLSQLTLEDEIGVGFIPIPK